MAARKIDGFWYVDFRFRRVRIRRRSPRNTKGGAQQFESMLRQELTNQGNLETLNPPHPQAEPEKTPTFAEYAEEWLTTYVRTNNRASEYRAKTRILHQHLIPQFGTRVLSKIQRRDVEGYKATKTAKGLTAKTINNHLTILGKCLRTAQEDDLLVSLPLIKWLPVKPPEFDFLTPLESHQLLRDRTEPMWADLARLALRTGMRRGELIALDWSAVDLVKARLTVRQSLVEGVMETPKTNRIRHLPLTSDVLAMLARHECRRGLVFKQSDGKPLSKRTMELGLDGLCRRAGVRHIGWHVLRHTYASQLAMEGVPLIMIRDLMGHSTIKMTERYAHLAPSPLAEAVPALLRAEARALKECGQPMGSELQFARSGAVLLPGLHG